MNIVFTGSSGHLAKVVLPFLLEHPEITTIYGVDKQAAIIQHKKYIHIQQDILNSNILTLLKNADILIHAAFILMGGKLGLQRFNQNKVKEINRIGSQLWINAAIDYKVNTVLFISSAAVYGIQTQQPITEKAILNPLANFSYAKDKVFIENWLKTLNTNTRIISLRLPAIVGPNAQKILKTLVHQPFYPNITYNPQYSCIWEQDVAHAMIAAIFSQAKGAFNIAAQGALGFKEMISIHNKNTYPLPFLFIKNLHPLLWYLNPAFGEPGWVEGFQHALVLDIQKAYYELAWQPSKDAYHCILDL